MDAAYQTPVAAGLLLVRGAPPASFLLLRHADRWDLPKGHVEAGETELEAAMRECEEETGITVDRLRVEPTFRYEHFYPVRSRDTGDWVEKKLVVFLAALLKPTTITVSEHIGYDWFDWPPTRSIQLQTIDRLLAAAVAWQDRTTRAGSRSGESRR